MINALFVEKNGVYSQFKGVELWDVSRNAKNCRNGKPAICHPPCERWGRYWSGGPSAKERRLLGDDGCNFAFCLWYVRTFGGVIEHPEASHAYSFYGLEKPPRHKGWIKADNYGGWCCYVEQGNYGHRARKGTWLYANGSNEQGLPALEFGPSSGDRCDSGFHSKEERSRITSSPGYRPVKRLSKKELVDTPHGFAMTLVALVENIGPNILT